MALDWLKLTMVGLASMCSPGFAAAASDGDAPVPVVPATGPASETDANVYSYAASFFGEFRPNTARDMVGRIPGFAFDGGSSGRGFSGTAGNVLIDGQRPPSRGDSLGDVLSRIPASAVERIDIIRAGAGGIDMQGRSIIANVIRKSDAGLAGAVSASATVSETGYVSPSLKIEAQNQSGGRLIEAALSLDRSIGSEDGLRLRTATDGALLERGESVTDFAYQSIEATGAFETALFGGQLRTNALASHRTDDASANEALIFPGGAKDEDSDGQRTSGEAGIRYTRDIAGAGLELVGFRSMTSETSTSADATPDYLSGSRLDRESGETIARATVKLPAGETLSLEAGAESVYNWVDSDNVRSLDGMPFVLAGDQNRVEEQRNEAFGAATWAVAKGLSVEAGARLERSTITAESTAGSSEKSLQFLKPRVNVSWSPAQGRQLGFRAERIVDQLSFSSFASTASFETGSFGVGNPDIEPLKAWEYEARYERQFGGQTSFVARYIHSELEDILGRVIVVEPANGATPERSYEMTRNTSDGSRDRLALDGALELDAYGLTGGLFSIGLDVRQSSTTDPVTLVERRLSGDRPYAWSVGLSQNLDDGRLKWSIYANDGAQTQSWQPRSISVHDNEVYAGVSMSWKPDAVWTMSGSLNNILASGEADDFTLYDGPRTTGSPLYDERTTSPGVRSARLNLRRNF